MGRSLVSRRMLLKAGGVVLAGSLPIPARAQQITLRIGAGHPPQALAYVGVADTFFIPEVQQRAREKGLNVRFIKAWSGTIAKLDGIIEAVQKGTLDIGLSVPSFEQARAGLLNYGLFFPFTSTDHLQQQKVTMRMLRDVPAIQDSMKSYNARVLQMSVSESYGLMLRKEVSSLQDLKGVRLACSGANAPWAQAVGAVPVQLPIGENYQGLKTGLIDGNIYFKSGFAAFKLDEVAKFFWKTGLGVIPSTAWFMNLETRQKLPPELVAIIDEVSAESSVKVAEIGQKRDEEIEAAFSGKGVIFKSLDRDGQRVWAEAMRDLPGNAAKDLDSKGLPGTTVFKTYVAYLRDAGYTFPYDYPL